MQSFKQLGLSKDILKAIAELGFENPSDIQEKAIPHLIHGEKDFIGLAQTGTGKTAAFGLPLLEQIDPEDPATQALILAPTRELGQQIAGQLALFSKYQDRVNVLPVYGGASIMAQMKALKKPQQIIIATPGRLIDLIERRSIQLNEIRFVVLDEADEMLNMGFKEDLDKILSFTPKEKRTWLFSATMPSEIRRLVKLYMSDPVEVKINPQNEVNVNIEHRYALVRHGMKPEALTRFIDMYPNMRALVFCRTKIDTQNLAEELMSKDYKADAIHGDLAQAQRDRVLKRFRENEVQIMIATDVASRGIDVSDITHVFHFNLPDEVAQYTHRSGRTARAGKQGMSVSLIYSKEIHRINRMANELKISFERLNIPRYTDISEVRMQAWIERILQEKSEKHLDKALVKKVLYMFEDLSKEEILSRLLTLEFGETSGQQGQQDLNDWDEHRGKHTNLRVRNKRNTHETYVKKGRGDRKGPRDQKPAKSRDRGKKKFEKGWKGN